MVHVRILKRPSYVLPINFFHPFKLIILNSLKLLVRRVFLHKIMSDYTSCGLHQFDLTKYLFITQMSRYSERDVRFVVRD